MDEIGEKLALLPSYHRGACGKKMPFRGQSYRCSQSKSRRFERTDSALAPSLDFFFRKRRVDTARAAGETKFYIRAWEKYEIRPPLAMESCLLKEELGLRNGWSGQMWSTTRMTDRQNSFLLRSKSMCITSSPQQSLPKTRA